MIRRHTLSTLFGPLVFAVGCSSNPFPAGSPEPTPQPLADRTIVGRSVTERSAAERVVSAASTHAVGSNSAGASETDSTVVLASSTETSSRTGRATPAIASQKPTGEPSHRTDELTNTAGQNVAGVVGASGPASPAILIASPIRQLDQIAVQANASQADAVPPSATARDAMPTGSGTTAMTSGLPANTVVLSLDNVLQMAEAQNPQIGLARERINEAYARALRADTLWLPSLRGGLNYNHHEGTIQDVAGTVFPTNRSSFYGGMGANAVGAGSPAVPGVMAQFHFADAWFQPEIAGHQAAARRFGATATRNDTLRDTSIAYLELARAEHAARIAQEAVINTRRLLDLTQSFAEAGQGLSSDFTRMQAELAVRLNDELLQQEAVRVASARLTQLLHADSGLNVVSGEPTIAPLDILNADGDAATYVAEGLMRRPELAEQKHLVCEAVQRLRREQLAPLVPSVLLGMSYGAMGGGLGSSIVNTGDRWDADAVAFWEVRNLGFGEQAARRESASQIRQAQYRKVAMLDQVAREVVEAHARVGARRARIALAESGISAAERSYQLNRERIENAQGLPIEVLQSIQALAVSRTTYLNTVTDYNIAQFQLCHATGALVR